MTRLAAAAEKIRRSGGRRGRRAGAGPFAVAKAPRSCDYQLARESQAVRSAWDLKDGLADLARFAESQKARVDRAVRDRAAALRTRAGAGYTPPARTEAAGIVVRRKRIGTIPLDELSREQREGWPRGVLLGRPTSALYWCDGKRNLAEVIRLTELEMGPQNFDFVGYFRFLEKHGYVEFVRGK